MGIYEQLNTQTAGNVTKTDYDRVSNPIHIQEKNKQALQDRVDVGLASNMLSTSGPIPGTSVVGYYQATTSGTRYSIYQPDTGEVYLLGPLSYQVTGASGTVTVEQWVFAPDNIDGTGRRVLLGDSSTSGSSYKTIYEGGPNTPTYIDDQASVRVEATGTFTSVQFYQYLIRVR